MRLDERNHRSLVLWATDYAEHILPYFEEKYPKDDRPRNAVEAGRVWVRGEVAMNEARAAARGAAQTAASAAGHAAATAHVAAHAANYAVTAATDAAVPTDSATAKERDCQYRRLPKSPSAGSISRPRQ
jgi:hypothetical protein